MPTLVFLLALLTPAQFVEEYYPYAQQVEDCTGVCAEVILTVAAVETKWGERAPYNNFFGIKGTEENGALARTVEYHSNTCWNYPVVYKIEKRGNLYRYVVLDYFRCYPTPLEGFLGYATVVEKYFPEAWPYRTNPKKFFKIICPRYATSPAAYTLTTKVLKIINREINEYELRKGEEICNEVR